MKNYLEKFLCVMLAVMLLTSMALPVFAEENTLEVQDSELQVAFLAPVGIAIGATEEAAIISIIIGTVAVATLNIENQLQQWWSDVVQGLLQGVTNLGIVEKETKPDGTDVYTLKDDSTDFGSWFYDVAISVDNLVNGGNWKGLYNRDLQKKLNEENAIYLSATSQKKKEMKIYFPISWEGVKIDPSHAMNLVEATNYVKGYKFPENKLDVNVFTICEEAATVLAQEVSRVNEDGGYSIYGGSSTQKAGIIPHVHPAKWDAAKGKITQAVNTRTGYTPHINYVIKWR